MNVHSVRRVASGCAAAAVTAAAALLFAGPAAAAVLANSGDAPQDVVIIEGAERTPLSLKPGERVTAICTRGCSITLVGVEDGTYVLAEGNEMVSVENGLMFYDGAEPPAAATDDTATDDTVRAKPTEPAADTPPKKPITR